MTPGRGRRRVGALYELPELRYPAAAAAAAASSSSRSISSSNDSKTLPEQPPYQTRNAQLPVVQHIIEIDIARPSIVVVCRVKTRQSRRSTYEKC
ncbi:hypothetical protein M0802_003833 [Mischocyttarus mexicanus]|nr:hypothetical protein M0802_003833 [Mischocyttarus mexicanus]